MGFTGSIDILRRYLATLTAPHKAAAKLTVRYETPPGRQAQADWTHCGKFADAGGKLVAIYAFVMVLSFSRMIFVRFTRSMKLPVLIDCHQRAFAFFGGRPATMLYDNMKQVKLNYTQWNPLFLDFAGHYGFAPKNVPMLPVCPNAKLKPILATAARLSIAPTLNAPRSLTFRWSTTRRSKTRSCWSFEPQKTRIFQRQPA